MRTWSLITSPKKKSPNKHLGYSNRTFPKLSRNTKGTIEVKKVTSQRSQSKTFSREEMRTKKVMLPPSLSPEIRDKYTSRTRNLREVEEVDVPQRPALWLPNQFIKLTVMTRTNGLLSSSSILNFSRRKKNWKE